MAMRSEVAVDLVSRLKDKGFRDLQKQTKSTEKVLAGLGKKLAGFFSAAALAKFSKDSVRAFLDDEKAAKSLTRTLGNLGLAFEDTRVIKFLADLEKTSGVVDDQLRPAFQRLIQTTGSVAKSQELLKLALDVSADGTYDLQTVAEDLSRAYVGNFKGLKKYSLGLSDAQMKTKSFADMQSVLNQVFGGQAATRLETYQGKVDQLNVAFSNLQETVGKALVDALSNAAGDKGVSGLVDEMEILGRKISNVIGFIDLMNQKLRQIPVAGKNLPGLFDVGNLPVIGAYIDLIDKYMQAINTAPKPFSTGMSVSGASDYYTKIERDRAAAEKAAAARAAALEKERLRKEKLLQAEKKRTAEIERLKSAIQFRFDIDAINLQAALRRNLSATDRERVLQLSALKISDYQNDEDAIKTLQAATQGRYDDAMNLEKMLQILKIAGFANDKSAIDALAALKPEIKFTDNLDDVISKLKALIEGKYTINIGATITVPPIPAPGSTNRGDYPGNPPSTVPPVIPPRNPSIPGFPGISPGDVGPGKIPSAAIPPIVMAPEANVPIIPGLSTGDFGPGKIPGAALIAAGLGLGDYGPGKIPSAALTQGVAAAASTVFDRVGLGASDFGPGRIPFGAAEPVVVNVNIAGSLLAEQDLVAAVTDAIYQTQRTGNPIQIAV